MLTKVISLLTPSSTEVYHLISWRHTLKRIGEELDLANRKRKALDDLLEAGRISRETYEMFKKEVDEAVGEVEARKKALIEEMNRRSHELEQQLRTLEAFLASSEIRYVTGDVDEETYKHENEVLTLGIESTKRELQEIQEAINQLNGREVDGRAIKVAEAHPKRDDRGGGALGPRPPRRRRARRGACPWAGCFPGPGARPRWS